MLDGLKVLRQALDRVHDSSVISRIIFSPTPGVLNFWKVSRADAGESSQVGRGRRNSIKASPRTNSGLRAAR